MRLNQWFRPPRHLLMLFLAIALTLVTALGWLSWRLLEQDRALESQRTQERLDHAADLVAAALLQNLTPIEEPLNRLAALPDAQLAVAAGQYGKQLGDEALVVVLRPRAIEAYPGSRLLYYPFLPAFREPAASVFAAGEAYEFQQKDYARAIRAFREMARSRDAAVRAGALLREGRNLRKARQPSAALAAYEELSRLGPTPVGGLPAELLARHARCALLEELQRLPELQHEAQALYFDLHHARWQLTSAAQRFYTQETRRWFSPDASLQAGDQEALALAAGVESLWEQWPRTRRGEGSPAGRRSLWVYDRPVLLLWRHTAERLVALVGGPRYFERPLLRAFEPIAQRQSVRCTLTDAEGHAVRGPTPRPAQRQVLRSPADTQLPWTLHVASADPRSDLSQLAARRRLLLAGLAMMAMLVLAGGYFITRAVTRELEVARLQSDFVAAVSHEFRTPLASLRQLSELLADGRVPSEQRRQEYYLGLQRESERLHRLVENLLDFGRMEAGAEEYRLRSLEAAAVVRVVAEEFAQEAEERGYRVEIRLHDPLPRVRADQEALGRALLNLLDNAVKYSPGCKTVWIEAACENSRVAIRVRDQGLGVTPSEQEQIFKKFVRAASAQAAGAKGTGLGLAMVRHIVAAHGGEIHVESEVGAGSTFTILLPAEKE